MEQEDPKQEIQEELDKLKALEFFDANYKRKKLITYAIRTLVAILLFGSFWDSEWVRWIAIAYIPVNLIGLGMILFPQVFMARSLNKLSQKMEELENENEDISESE
ncbi:MAG: hypothetical protein R8P61_04655 [Bacteroidia bacterium]|nr:hypothetical protein [Bacteroidia bacterium]